jgi:hypothetical protein
LNVRLFASLLLLVALLGLGYGYIQFASADPTSRVTEMFYQDEHERDIELRQAYLKLPLTETLDKRGVISMARVGRAENGRTLMMVFGVLGLIAACGLIATAGSARPARA